MSNTFISAVPCTLGMLTESQAKRLADAGLYAYNHNLDTSEENYNNVITTRIYKNRFGTIANVRKAGGTVTSGGIFLFLVSKDYFLLNPFKLPYSKSYTVYLRPTS